MYQVPALHSVCDLVYTNKVPHAAWETGNTQMHLAHETHLDEVAEMLGIGADEIHSPVSPFRLQESAWLEDQ